jgi:hypothetical protein
MRKRALIVAAGVVATMLIAGYVQAGAAPPAPPDQKVREQNLDGSGWIAVHEQGTASVSITGTPGVNVTGGTLNVGNLPAVQTVTDANLPALNPFQESANATLDGPDEQSCIEIPQGMRLVLEYVSGEITVPEGLRPYRVSLRTILEGTETTSHFLEPHVIRTEPGGYDDIQFGGPITAYADGYFQDIELCLTVWRKEAGLDWDFSWSVSGYLVEL